MAKIRDALAVRLTKRLVLSGNYDRALRRLHRLSLGRPTARISALEGAIHAVAGCVSDSEQCFRRALVLAGNAEPGLRCDVLCSLGLLLADTDRDEESQRCFQQAVELGVNTGTVSLATGTFFVAKGQQPDKALGLIEETMRRPLDNLRRLACLSDKVVVLAQLGRYQDMDESIAVLLHEIDPSKKIVFAAVHRKIGRALNLAGRASEAMEHSRIASEADPDGR
jgi:tetratricopeptide (TPR) repeat protein